ncbi:MAG: leucyl/phenylalanyl-tRNA--protein transferase [Endozoicomonas sp.]
MGNTLYLLDEEIITFPPVSKALTNPDGLLAMGGNLKVDTLIEAYRSGIFPWFNHDEPVLWWSPDPRMILYPSEIHVSGSLKKLLKKRLYTVTMDSAFEQVIQACSEPRPTTDQTWITEDMKSAYLDLYQAGYAHSVEVWQDTKLVGGLYGVALDKVFFGESMFSRKPNTSKVALVYLCGLLRKKGFELLDCQVPSQHLSSLGARVIARQEFTKLLGSYCRTIASDANWKLDWQWTANIDERTERP